MTKYGANTSFVYTTPQRVEVQETITPGPLAEVRPIAQDITPIVEKPDESEEIRDSWKAKREKKRAETDDKV
jgi:hypothetical protein